MSLLLYDRQTFFRISFYLFWTTFAQIYTVLHHCDLLFTMSIFTCFPVMFLLWFYIIHFSDFISESGTPLLCFPYCLCPQTCFRFFVPVISLFLFPSRVHVSGVTLSGETPVMLISVFSQEAPVGSSEWLALLLGMSLCLVLFGVTQYNQCVQNWSHLHHNMTVFYPRHCVILGHLVHWRNKRHHISRVAAPPECGAFFTNSRHYLKKIKHQILQ